MKYKGWMFLVLTMSLAALVVLAAQGVVAATDPAPAADGEADPEDLLTVVECVGENILRNPSFEGQYASYVPPGGHPDCPFGICTTAQMAPEWSPYWRSHNPSDPGHIIRMPEYKKAEPFFNNPPRVRSGQAAQQYFTFYSTHEAGLYQRLAVAPNTTYCFSAWGHSWSADDDGDAFSGPVYGQLEQKIGVDPTGGTNWQSGNVIWGPQRQQYDYYGPFSVMVSSLADHMTVFLYSQPAWAVKHNDVHWDDAALVRAFMTVNRSSALFLHGLADRGPARFRVGLEMAGRANMVWTATVEPGATFTPTFLPASGGLDDDLVVQIDSSGLGVGTYQATVRLTASEPIPGSPHFIPVTLIVKNTVDKHFLSAVTR